VDVADSAIVAAETEVVVTEEVAEDLAVVAQNPMRKNGNQLPSWVVL
jgi:hypothetical protein